MVRALVFLGVLLSTTLLIDAFKVDKGFSLDARGNDFVVDCSLSPEPRENDFKVDNNFSPEPRENGFKADYGFSPEPRDNDFKVDNGFQPEPRENDFSIEPRERDYKGVDKEFCKSFNQENCKNNYIMDLCPKMCSKVTGEVFPCTQLWTKILLAPGESANFQSPNYPDKYDSGSFCLWPFHNTADAGITITCSDFRLQPKNKNGTCEDKFRLGIGDVFCGNSLTSYSGGRSLQASFRSDRSRNFNGFSCTAAADYPTYATEPATMTNEPDEGTCKCGRVNRIWRSPRIVGGWTAQVNEYPWQAVMVYSGTRNICCGASVIGSKHLLTAAHCTYGKYYQDYQFLVGAHSLTNPASSELRLDGVSFLEHPGYVKFYKDNDIAIIELKESISFTSSEIRPVCLPKSDDNDFSDVMATVSGWGDLEHYGYGPDVLKTVDVPTMTNTQCRRYYSNENITENMICAGYEEGGKDSCQNDSGGPLIYNFKNIYTQIGVVSWGYECALPVYPGVYVRVTKYLPWIKSNTASSTTCPAA